MVTYNPMGPVIIKDADSFFTYDEVGHRHILLL